MSNGPKKSARGLIERHISQQHFDLTIISPSDPLAGLIANYWLVEWDLPADTQYSQLNLPHASQHLVVDPQIQSGVFGITSGAFEYQLSGRGRVFGAKFLPGHFRRIAQHSMAKLTDQAVPISSYFDVDDNSLESRFGGEANSSDFAPFIEDLLIAVNPVDDPKAQLAQSAVSFIEQNLEIFTVNSVARHCDMSPRALQRLFAEYVGISPKWVIERYRMIEAVEAMNNKGAMSFTELAHALGYFDQAHFSKAFRRLVGRSPSEILAP